MLFENLLFEMSIYIFCVYIYIYSPTPDMLHDPPHIMINECNPLTELISSIHHFSTKTLAKHGRKCREKFTETTTKIRKKKKQNNSNKNKKSKYSGPINMSLGGISVAGEKKGRRKKRSLQNIQPRSSRKKDSNSNSNSRKKKSNSNSRTKESTSKSKKKKKSRSNPRPKGRRNPDKEENDDDDDEDNKTDSLFEPDDDKNTHSQADKTDVLGEDFSVSRRDTYNVALDKSKEPHDPDDPDEIFGHDMFDDNDKNKNKKRRQSKRGNRRRILTSPKGRQTARRSARLNKKLGDCGKGRVLVDNNTEELLDAQDYPSKLKAFYVCYIYIYI